MYLGQEAAYGVTEWKIQVNWNERVHIVTYELIRQMMGAQRVHT